MGNAWIGVVGALGGVILTGLLGVATAVLNHRWTAETTDAQRRHEVALRQAETRRVAYARYLSAANNVLDAVQTAEPPAETTDHGKLPIWYRTQPQLVQELQVADSEAKIVASDTVFTALVAYEDKLTAYMNDVLDDPDNDDADPVWEAQRDLLAAMRAEQAGKLGP